MRVAKRKKAKSKTGAVGGALGRGLSSLWRFIAKSLGSSVRFLARGARDLDPAHQRDGIAFLILIIALIGLTQTMLLAVRFIQLSMADLVKLDFSHPLFLSTLPLDYSEFQKIQRQQVES